MGCIPKVAAINDMSGFGRCSLTIAMPVLSVLGVQCCPVPTAILSCHTGFGDFFFKDLTEILPDYISNWGKNGVAFDAVYSGFLGSSEQIKITENFILSSKKKPLCVVDTVMGDRGEIYPTYTAEMCSEMRKLVSIADVITPNVTEACYLTDTPYTGENIELARAASIADKLCKMGAESVIITGISGENTLTNLVFENGLATEVVTPKSEKSFSGTGDMFASVVTGLLCNGKTITSAVEIASKFIYDAIQATVSAQTEVLGGVQFEPLLYKLGGGYYG